MSSFHLVFQTILLDFTARLGLHGLYLYLLPNPIQYDYTKGQLPELVDVIIEEKATLFVCAIGVPPREVVDKLHKAGILIMNVRSILQPLGQEAS